MTRMDHIVTPHSMIALGIVMPVIAGIAVGTRMWIRWSKKTALQDHDYLVVAAYIILLSSGIAVIYGGASDILASRIPTGDGPKDFMFVKTPKLVTAEKMKFALNLLNIPAIGFVKLSVLCWYRTIFRGRVFNAITIGLIVILSLWIVAIWFAYFFQCGTDFGAFWSDLHDLLTRCNKYAAYHNQVTAIPDFITDAVIIMIPIPLIWKLHMDTTKKVGLCFVFLLGAFATGAALTRLLVYQESLSDRFTQPQGIVVISIWMFWSLLELGISIVAACLPVMASLLGKDWFQNLSASMRQFGIILSSLPRLRSRSSRQTISSQEESPMGPDMSESRLQVPFRGDNKGRVRTSVSSGKIKRDPEIGLEDDELLYARPGTIVAKTDIRQFSFQE